ncbi:MAG: 2-amino-4-hydroxy-6-hydroxymethyldihydropteridine diphosphokinase [Desulfocapsa sp.]|nr:2-amino-4-hydroxy-6-hydroxymethyldihydropteridine diphosphokinase [Desulfocapsa sp.]
MSGKTRVWLGLGSNLGDSRRILQKAWQQLGSEPGVNVLTLSAPYASDPVGMESENRFLNAAGILETDLDPDALLNLLQQVEKGFGRDQKTGGDGYQDRLLDLDILYFGDHVINSGNLLVPHPHIAGRLFVLVPLVELDPEHRDPVTGHTVKAMRQELLRRMESGRVVRQQIQPEKWG